jgi:glycine/D-amino acid oxidase-like deaminating enzyme
MAAGRRVGVLGGGIMGCSLALFLARNGAHVSLFDEAAEPFSGASRWNEGKVHLGYLYAGDPSLDTARKLIDGGLLFRDLVEELLEQDISPAVSPRDDIYLMHRSSIVDADSMSGYFNAVSGLIRGHPSAGRYFSDLTNAGSVGLSAAELGNITRSEAIVAGFRAPERSILTNWIADRYVAAIRAEPSIELLPNARIEAVAGSAGKWRVSANPAIPDAFDVIVNCLWHGREAVDRASGFAPNASKTSYRYRASAFLRCQEACKLPSAVLAVGPFGDIKNYNDRDLYLSWYSAGLIEDRTDGPSAIGLDPPAKDRILAGTVNRLSEYFPELVDIVRQPASLEIAGGWVVAHGTGSLEDPLSPLHRRDRFGISRFGSYFSVDTGKYSTAPWLAKRLANEITG